MGKRYKQTLHQENMNVSNKQMKIFSTLLVIK